MSFRPLGHVLLTGAAGAIGGALARALRQRDPAAQLSLVDRDPERLDAMASAVGGTAHVWDLSKPTQLDDALARLSPVDVLVNCAGIMDLTALVASPWARTQQILDVDLISPLRLMSALTPRMVERGAGGVINVSSMAGVVPLRGGTAYGAAKAGLAMASEIARLELAPAGVNVLTVYPGPVSSPLERRARDQVASNAASRWIPLGDPDDLAARIVTAWDRRSARVVYPGLYHWGWRFPRLSSHITQRLSPAPR